MLHDFVGVSYGSIGLDSIRVGNKNKQKKARILFTNFNKTEPLKSLAQLNIQSTRKIEQAPEAQQDLIDLYLMMSNIMHPNIYGGYFPKIGSSISELKFITGELLFPTGPQELRLSFERIKMCKETGKKIELNSLLEIFE